MGWLNELNNLVDEIKTDWEDLKKDIKDDLVVSKINVFWYKG